MNLRYTFERSCILALHLHFVGPSAITYSLLQPVFITERSRILTYHLGSFDGGTIKHSPSKSSCANEKGFGVGMLVSHLHLHPSGTPAGCFCFPTRQHRSLTALQCLLRSTPLRACLMADRRRFPIEPVISASCGRSDATWVTRVRPAPAEV